MLKITSIVLFAVFLRVHSEKYKLVCYYTNWSQYRTGNNKFLPEDIDPKLCTHVNFAFARINENNELDSSEWNDEDLYSRVIKLKSSNPKLKVLLSVGGYTHEDGHESIFSRMVNNDGYRQKFVDSVVPFLRKWGFDGLDLDWEYPAGRGNSPPGDKQKFTVLVEDLMLMFKLNEAMTGKKRLLLSAAVPVGKKKVEAGYEVDKLGENLNWINLMAYDLHGNWEMKTGHHTAMESSDGSLTVPAAIDNWIDKGFPADKIVLGLATYGRSFNLEDPNKNGLNVRAGDDVDPDWPEPIKEEINAPPAGVEGGGNEGYMAYRDICKEEFTIVTDNEAKAPYGYKGKKWIGFDDESSLIYKVNSQIQGKRLAGAMIWTLDLDDFSGSNCGKGSYPLLTAIHEELNKSAPTTTPPTPTPPTPTPPIPPLPTTRKVTTKGGRGKCIPVGAWKRVPGMVEWCENNCPSCERSRCSCPGDPVKNCVAAGAFKGQEAITEWCVMNCAADYCPSSHCKCQDINL